ncbi:IS3 family transposase [Brevibacillus sp. FIR094]|uniref:IS3 family transposase n=1 Tax=Brevibacillus sp. FIR094 TaxID=3134809 RepID=UPI003D20AD38
MESFFSHLKVETMYFSECKTEEELFQAIENYIWFYNNERFQKKLNQCAPVECRITRQRYMIAQGKHFILTSDYLDRY